MKLSQEYQKPKMHSWHYNQYGNPRHSVKQPKLRFFRFFLYVNATRISLDGLVGGGCISGGWISWYTSVNSK